MTVRRAILVLFVAAFLVGFAAADVDPRDILPTTEEFQGAFGSDWKHPWDFPTDHPLYETQGEIEDEFALGLEMASSPEMAEMFEDLDLEELGVDIEELLGDATGGQSLGDMLSESAEIIENSAYAIDKYIVTYGELEQSGGGYALDRLEAKLQVQVMDEDYVRNHPEAIDAEMATTIDVPDVSGPGFDMEVIEKGFGDTSSCAQTISNGKVYSETCAVKVCNLQFSIELIRSTDEHVWNHDQIDALLEIVEARMEERVSDDLCTVTEEAEDESTTSVEAESTSTTVEEETTTVEYFENQEEMKEKAADILQIIMDIVRDILRYIQKTLSEMPLTE